MTELADGASTPLNSQLAGPSKLPQVVTYIGLGLVPVAALLCIINLALAATHLRSLSELSNASLYPHDPFGISTRRKDAEIALNSVVPLLCPLLIVGMGFDLLGTGLDRRQRFAVVGYVGTLVSALALVIVVGVT
jgi:hypothetical protein